jgi:nanoRNase/pAp phosphatase (c-di-AMP/oligoRNAs hydrolase)
MKISHIGDDKEQVRVGVGHNIFNRSCNVNIGLMLSLFEGGGHRGAGGCIFHASKTNEYIPQIIDILLNKKTNGKMKNSQTSS